MQKSKFPTWIQRESDRSHIDYSIFSTVENSDIYSLLPFHIDQVRKFFLDNAVKSPSIIIDGTGHIGCDTINLAHFYPRSTVLSFEIDEKTYEVLSNNIDQFCLKYGWDVNRVFPIHADITKYPLPKADFIYIDPPWGPDYKKYKSIDLFLSDMSIETIIDRIFELGVTKQVFVKAPYNFKGFENLKFDVTSKKIMTPGGKVSFIMWCVSMRKSMYHTDWRVR